jgi:drug/metabolite transporter (DMT)-like permease
VSIVYVGLLSTAFTFALMALALKHMPAPRASVLLSTETLFAAAAGYILLGERLSLIGWVGAILILMAVLVLTKERSLS